MMYSKMKSICVAIIAMVVLSMSVQAQISETPDHVTSPKERLSPEERAQKHTLRMKKHLGLGEKQTAEILDINTRYATQLAVQRKQQRSSIREQQQKEILALLTPEQKATLKRAKAERKAQMTEHFERERKMHRGEHKAMHKKLTPAQRADKVTEKMREKYQLTAEQTAAARAINLKYAELRAAAHEKHQQSRKQQETEILQVLTPAQAKQWELLKEKKAKKH